MFFLMLSHIILYRVLTLHTLPLNTQPPFFPRQIDDDLGPFFNRVIVTLPDSCIILLLLDTIAGNKLCNRDRLQAKSRMVIESPSVWMIWNLIELVLIR